MRESGQYRILTPDEWAQERAEDDDPGMPIFHPMVGGIPPELAWRHLHLFEEAFLGSEVSPLTEVSDSARRPTVLGVTSTAQVVQRGG